MTDAEMRHLSQDVAEIREKVDRIDQAIRGNDRGPGLTTRVSLLEQFRDGASKLVWLVIGSAIAAVTSAGAAIANAMAGGAH